MGWLFELNSDAAHRPRHRGARLRVHGSAWRWAASSSAASGSAPRACSSPASSSGTSASRSIIATLDFVKEFGLVLFVFTIGLQLGPGFFAALRQQGVRMNALAAAIVMLGAVQRAAHWLARGLRPGGGARHLLGRVDQHAVARRGDADARHAPGHRGRPPRAARPRLRRHFPDGDRRHHRHAAAAQRIFRIDPAQEAVAFAARTAARSSRSNAARWS